MKKIIFFAFIAIVAGCVALPTPEEIASADYGRLPDDYDIIVKSYYGSVLKNPDSAIYKEITYPQKIYLGNRFEAAKYGYLVCVTMNAKNSHGKYAGYETNGLLIRNGIVIQPVDKGLWFGKKIC